MTFIDDTTFILAALAMGMVTFVQRALPTLIPKKLLNSPQLKALNSMLPLAVMVLLILASLPLLALLPWTSSQNTADSSITDLVAQMLALLGVLVVYHRTRHLLLSMLAGIALINLFLWLL